MKLRKGDTIKVLIGKDKGKTGQIERVYPARDQVLVAGVNEYKRHLKSRSQNQKSEIITITKPLPVSNVAMLCPKCKKVTRIGIKLDKDGKKVRVCAKCRKEIN
jgi:large subunit ribosomal protein L24